MPDGTAPPSRAKPFRILALLLAVAGPAVTDDLGTDWGDLLARAREPLGIALGTETVVGVGLAWRFADLPPGRYDVRVGGADRGTFTVEAGGTTTSR